MTRLFCRVAAALALVSTASGGGDAVSDVRGAIADGRPSVSSNWAGYVATGGSPSRAPIVFSGVSGRWVLPKADCRSTTAIGPTASAIWVGLGGRDTRSRAVEQTGTEADCSPTGVPHYFAWYELAPLLWVRLHVTLMPGDTIAASVSVSGRRVSVRLRNLSRRTGFAKTTTMAFPDTSSAEWIVEAPSVCTTMAFCGEQLLTDFGTVRFTDAMARIGAHSGSIADAAWQETGVRLHEGGEPFGGFAPEQNAADAVPTELTRGGSAFSVTWNGVSTYRRPGDRSSVAR